MRSVAIVAPAHAQPRHTFLRRAPSTNIACSTHPDLRRCMFSTNHSDRPPYGALSSSRTATPGRRHALVSKNLDRACRVIAYGYPLVIVTLVGMLLFRGSDSIRSDNANLKRLSPSPLQYRQCASFEWLWVTASTSIWYYRRGWLVSTRRTRRATMHLNQAQQPALLP